MGRIEDWMVAEEGLMAREFSRRIAALWSPTAPCERQVEEQKETEVMNSGELGVVSRARS
jgi:hypothetical protein